MRPTRAFCPRCDAQGSLGLPCENPLCRPHFSHYLPSDRYIALRERPAATRDARLATRLSDVLLVERLSRGAFGQLYLGLQVPLLMHVAVKVFDPLGGADVDRAELAQMFEHEARALATLSHPNIVRLLDFDNDHDPPFIIMEYVDNARTLRDVMASARRRVLGRMPALRAESILRQILAALEEAHARGVVHLDLRPDNIGIQQPAGYEDFVRLLDFGLATRLDEETESRGFGTPQYIAPERIVGATATPAADLYAVGVMAYELLIGDSPFGDRDPDDVVRAKRDATFDPGAALAGGDHPETIVAFFRQALARDPSERFENAAIFRARLEPVVDYFSGRAS